MEYKKYPVYSWQALVKTNRVQQDNPQWILDRYENETSNRYIEWHSWFNWMTKEMMPSEYFDCHIRKCWELYLQKHEKENINPELVSVNLEFKGYEEFCMTWFSHYTFDIGQSDSEILSQFTNFVYSKIDFNHQNGYDEHGISYYNNNNNSPYLLMGANDHWRWKVCRCDACKARGVITIEH